MEKKEKVRKYQEGYKRKPENSRDTLGNYLKIKTLQINWYRLHVTGNRKFK